MRKFIWLLTVLALLLSGCSTALAPTESPIAASLAGAMAEGFGAQTVPIEGGSFVTKYDEGLKNRTTNLEVSAKAVDGTILMPGEVFSFNEIIGKATRAKGYRNAKIFINGREVDGMGGGICQLSSTLYNAADFAGLKIVERHPHSKRVEYVKVGRDAATAYRGVDLKFENNTDAPVKIVAKAQKGELYCGIETVIA